MRVKTAKKRVIRTAIYPVQKYKSTKDEVRTRNRTDKKKGTTWVKGEADEIRRVLVKLGGD